MLLLDLIDGMLPGGSLRLSVREARRLEDAIRANLSDLLESPSDLHDDGSHPHPRGMDFISTFLQVGSSDLRFIRDRGELRIDHRSDLDPGWGPVYSDFFEKKATAVRRDDRCVQKACEFVRRNWKRLEQGQQPS